MRADHRHVIDLRDIVGSLLVQCVVCTAKPGSFERDVRWPCQAQSRRSRHRAAEFAAIERAAISQIEADQTPPMTGPQIEPMRPTPLAQPTPLAR